MLVLNMEDRDYNAIATKKKKQVIFGVMFSYFVPTHFYSNLANDKKKNTYKTCYLMRQFFKIPFFTHFYFIIKTLYSILLQTIL